MSTNELRELFEKHRAEYLEFGRITRTSKTTERPDLHAFIMLDNLCSGTMDIVGSAEHDEIWLDVDLGELASKISEAQVVDLIRCGVRLSEYDSLAMFV